MLADKKPFLAFSLPLFLMIAGVSLVGLFFPDIYQGFTENWLAQTIGQDTIDLLVIAPVLLVSAVFSFRGHAAATAMWVGSLLYIAYTFVIYCFSVRFNVLFISYCLILGLSFYALVWFFTSWKYDERPLRGTGVARTVGVYFMIIAVLFSVLWLADIIPANLRNEIPATLLDAGLYTNPVHVLDLALFLPATFIVGRKALALQPIARLLMPAFLTFFILMDITIASLSLIMNNRDAGGSLVVAGAMTVLALFTTFLLVLVAQKELT